MTSAGILPKITLSQIDAEIERRKRNRIVSLFPDVGPWRRELYARHMEFFAEATTASIYNSIDEVVHHLERQVRKNKELVRNHKVVA